MIIVAGWADPRIGAQLPKALCETMKQDVHIRPRAKHLVKQYEHGLIR